MQPDEAPAPEVRTVRDEAERLLGSRPDASMSDAAIKRMIVNELLDDVSDRSDSFVEGAFKGLIFGDGRMVMARREMRRAAATRQIRQLEQMQPGEPN